MGPVPSQEELFGEAEITSIWKFRKLRDVCQFSNGWKFLERNHHRINGLRNYHTAVAKIASASSPVEAPNGRCGRPEHLKE